MNRRKFVIAFVGIVITSVLTLFVLKEKLYYYLKRQAAGLRNHQFDKDYAKGVISDEEMKTIIALSEVLVSENEMARIKGFVREHVHYRTTNHKAYLKEYKDAVKLLGEKTKEVFGTNRSFFELTLLERNKVLGSILRKYRAILWKYRADKSVPILERIFLSKRESAFRDFVARDILMAFYRYHGGWALVGYSHYPGVLAADPRDYTRPLDSLP